MENPSWIDKHLDIGDLENSLGFLLRICQVKVYDQFFNYFHGLDIRPGEFSVWWVIHLNPGVMQGDVAEMLRIRPAHMTKIIRRGEENGWVRRTIPDNNRRSVSLALTETGETFVTKLRDSFFGADSYHHHSLSEEEHAQLTVLLRKYACLHTKRAV